MTQHNVAPYLLERKLISEASIVEGNLMVVDSTRRNHNFEVVSERNPSYLAKQGVGASGIATVAHEAVVYQFLQSETESDINRYLPRCYGYDPEAGILILELVTQAQNLGKYHSRRGRFSITLARALGNALGTLHSLTGAKKIKDNSNLGLSDQPPWTLSIHRPSVGTFRNVSDANIQLIKIIQQFPEFCELLSGLSHDWRTGTLIHGDIKWDNLIVFPQSDSGRITGLKIVDWEFAGVGDPCWDVGSVFTDYLGCWLLSIPITGEFPPDRFMELAHFPLERMQPAIHSFWQSYVRQMELDSPTSDEWLLRSIRYSAGRLVQTAFEHMQASMQLTGNIVCFLQLSLNILQRPQEAIVHLLGLPLREVSGE